MGIFAFVLIIMQVQNQSLVLSYDKLQLGADASYSGPFFVSLWTFCKMYFIQMLQTHCKIINLTKIFMNLNCQFE
jgi:hypothetical protein